MMYSGWREVQPAAKRDEQCRKSRLRRHASRAPSVAETGPTQQDGCARDEEIEQEQPIETIPSCEAEHEHEAERPAEAQDDRPEETFVCGQGGAAIPVEPRDTEEHRSRQPSDDDGAKRSGDHQSEVPRPIAGLRNVPRAVTTVPIASVGQARVERQGENLAADAAPQPGNLRAVRSTAPVAAGWVSGSESVFPRRPPSNASAWRRDSSCVPGRGDRRGRCRTRVEQ